MELIDFVVDDDGDRLINESDTNQAHGEVVFERHEHAVLYLQLILVNFVQYNRLRRWSHWSPRRNKKNFVDIFWLIHPKFI